MHRFRIVPPCEGTVRLPEEESKHALRVLRLREGDPIELTDGGGGLYSAVITDASEGVVCAEVGAALDGCESPARITVYQGLPKGDKLETIAQKLTELGAARLAPVRMERCVVKLDEKDAEKKRARMQKIADEAVKQCGRACAMEVAPPMRWADALRDMAKRELMLMPWEAARGVTLGDQYALHTRARDIGLLIGSEGGIAPHEAEEAMEAGAVPVTLGPRILRTETASIVACAIAQQLWGDLS